MSGDGVEQTRERLLAYLLGELPAEELAAFDVRLLRDADFAASLEAARVDLLEEYALGACTDRRRERIAQALNLSGAQDESVRFARALAPALARLAPARAVRARSGVSREPLRWALPLAACALLGVGLWRYSPWRHADGRAVRSSTPATFTVLLRPARLRSASGLRVVHIPGAAQQVRVQIVLRHAVGRAEVILRHDSSALRVERLAVHHLGATPFVQFILPRRRLAPGQYQLRVRSHEHGRLVTDRYRLEIAPP